MKLLRGDMKWILREVGQNIANGHSMQCAKKWIRILIL